MINSLEEAIDNYEEETELYEERCKFYEDRNMPEYIRGARECASEYRQLVKWLKELKAYKDARVGCEYCKHKYREIHERPCSLCKRNFVDMFEIEEDGE